MRVDTVRAVDNRPGAIRRGHERTRKGPNDGPRVFDDNVEDR
jgi:hypothetical protein